VFEIEPLGMEGALALGPDGVRDLLQLGDAATLARSLLHRVADPTLLQQWLRALMIGPGDEFYKQLAQVQGSGGGSGVCAYTFKGGEPAYMCRTCGSDSTCIQCMSCFKDADHVGHDYRMVHSGGGVCDCGDLDSWSIEGCCSQHRGPDTPPTADISSLLPPDLMERVSAVTDLIVGVLSQCMRPPADGTRPDMWPSILLPRDALTRGEQRAVVVLHNDDTHSFSQVVRALTSCPMLPAEGVSWTGKEASTLAYLADSIGRTAVYCGPLAQAQAVVAHLEQAQLTVECCEIDQTQIVLDLPLTASLLSLLLEISKACPLFSETVGLAFLQPLYAASSLAVTGLPDRLDAFVLFGSNQPTLWPLAVELLTQLNTDPEFKARHCITFTSHYRALIARVRVRAHTRRHAHTHTHPHTHTYTHTHTHIHTHRHTYTYTRMYTHTHTYTHIYTHEH
jgi:hypothetical protein